MRFQKHRKRKRNPGAVITGRATDSVVASKATASVITHRLLKDA